MDLNGTAPGDDEFAGIPDPLGVRNTVLDGLDSAAEFLGINEVVLDRFDPSAFRRSLARVTLEASRHPELVAGAAQSFITGSLAATAAAARRLVGQPAPGPRQPDPRDRRFADDTWTTNPAYFLLMQNYLLWADFVFSLVDAAGLDQREDRKARFAAQMLVDTMSPTNTLLGNPEAMKTAIASRGASVVSGLRNMVNDVLHNGGWPRQVDSSGFELGRNTAATPGQVVYRSDLIELIQYEPRTDSVHEIPLLLCPPWINKYYIMDLAPGRSLIEWALDHGHTCFAISYRNPDASMADTTFEDYLFQGPLDAVRVVREITDAESVNTLSVCLGGTLTAMAMAHEANEGSAAINTATFLNTLTDFSNPGVLDVFTDEDTVARLEKSMAKKGFLEAAEMARTFDALRANDLIFNYVVSNWLKGESPPAFDLLAWNADSTRMPATMHSTYLRSCYLENQFAKGRFKIRNKRIKPERVTQDCYVLSAVQDHIVPWTSAYRTALLLGGENRFVLSTSGHIAGIVSPPSPKARHWTNDTIDPDPEVWRAGAEQHDETWWEDWSRWIAERRRLDGSRPRSGRPGSPAPRARPRPLRAHLTRPARRRGVARFTSVLAGRLHVGTCNLPARTKRVPRKTQSQVASAARYS